MKSSTPSIMELNKKELIDFLQKIGEKSFRAHQIFDWIYLKRCFSFDEMSNLSLTLRNRLNNSFTILDSQIHDIQLSHDGTRKYVFLLNDGNFIESVYIQKSDSYTLCLSSQVGCVLGCRFCATAKIGPVRNLHPYEIVSQALLILADVKLEQKGNIVFMGMGEPLLNTDNVCRAIEIFVSEWGLNWSSRRITLSTSGIIPEIQRFTRKMPKINLAVSLNAADNKTRKKIMPISAKYSLESLIETLKNLKFSSNQQKITIEYVLINKVNDQEKDSKQLAKILDPKRFKINLIPLNDTATERFKAPEPNQILTFQKILHDNGYTVRIRKSEGADISAACGQLAGHYLTNESIDERR